MTTQKETSFSKDLPNKKLLIEREFDAPQDRVWKAWTDSSILDQWWAPKPWKAKTKSMDFREDGTWLYSMVGPNGEESFCRADFKTIVPQKQFVVDDAFCDENGNINSDLPSMHWEIEFSETATGTKVNIEASFDSEADLEKILEMGFKEGFAMAHGNLDALLVK
jgi:uncharacterized protein YndB with AHSA1/START domain